MQLRFFYLLVMTAIFSLEAGPKVVVIGGGIAGLTAAYRLHEGGMEVELYEARGRVGGRILTANVNGRIAELGGHNINDGGESIHINRFIDEFGLDRSSWRMYLRDVYFGQQELVSVRELLKAKKFDPQALREKIDEAVVHSSNMKEVLEQIIDPQDPLYKILAVRMAAYEGGALDQLSPRYAETLFHMILGGTCTVQQGSEDENSCIDHLVSVKGGNSLLSEKIKERLGPRIHLNMPLIKVAKGEDDGYSLSFKNGEEVRADILILAIPCSVYEFINFEKHVIPLQKLQAIQNVRYGKNAKIMVPFANPNPTTIGLIGETFVSFYNDLQHILIIYYTGDSSLFSPDTIANAYYKARPMMEMGFGQDCPAFSPPQYAQDQTGLSYDGPVGYSWPNDPYARGTYSYVAAGQEEVLTTTEVINGETFRTLFAPIDKRLYFAGEHASILFDVPGTMEAACESGERVARAVLNWCSSAISAL